MESSSGGQGMPKIMVFRPTMEEFKDFPKYIEYIESQGAHKAGVCKIIPPPEWVPRKRGYDDVDLVVPAPINQMVTGCQGLYTQYNIQKKPIRVKEFEKLANSDRYKTPRHFDYDELERKYWKNISFSAPLYGADVSGSLYDEDQHVWNINRLGTILDYVEGDYGIHIEGVNTAYLYFGMWKTTFAWHTEDMDLYSINYVHFGAPKSWYAIPPEHGRRLERLAQGFFPGSFQACPAFLRHKMTLISPHILKRYSIPFQKITQEAGEFMITFPYGYHSGYNHGFNCAESTNFATQRWIEYGKRCLQCVCSKDGVKISMDCFVKRFQPDIYELWKAGKDIAVHPEEDHSKKGVLSQPIDGVRKIEANSSGRVSSKRHPISSLADMERSRKRGKGMSKVIEMTSAPDEELEEVPEKDKKCKGGITVPIIRDEDSSSSSSSSSSLENVSESCINKMVLDNEENSQDATMKSHKEEISKPKTFIHPEPWAKYLTPMWQEQPHNLDTEINFNQFMSHYPPYCAICSLFKPNERVGDVDFRKPCSFIESSMPEKSLPMIPEICFAASSVDPSPFVDSPVLDEDGCSSLLVCAKCKVCVHASCYGVFDVEINPWKCTRCVNHITQADCALCFLRGGALKPTTDGRWVHVTCALAITEVNFEDVKKREPVNMVRLTEARLKLKCIHCCVLTKNWNSDAACTQCSLGRCTQAFHVTCAHAAGVRFETSDWPYPVYVTCQKHMAALKEKTKPKHVMDIFEHDSVLAKHKNGRYYQAEVTAIDRKTYYEVDFDDGSFSDNLFPEDIVSHDCLLNGPPEENQRVQIKWTDAEVYGAIFRRVNNQDVFTVEFEDGFQKIYPRDDLWAEGEELPKHIKSKLSKATERKYDTFYSENAVLCDKRRPKQKVSYLAMLG